MSRVPLVVADAVHARADGHCEACTLPLPSEGGVFHHRKLRSRGGRDEADNLMEVHPACHNGHTNSIHARPARSIRLGHMVPSWAEPGEVEVVASRLLLRQVF